MKHINALSPVLLSGLLSLAAACGSNEAQPPTVPSAVVINEVMPSNKNTCVDEQRSRLSKFCGRAWASPWPADDFVVVDAYHLEATAMAKWG